MLTRAVRSEAEMTGVTPERAIARWPADVGLAVWWSGEPSIERRYTVLAVPEERVAAAVPPSRGSRGPEAAGSRGVPRGGWMGVLGYELGGEFEPRMSGTRGDWPCALWMRWNHAWVYDHVACCWTRVGSPPALGESGAGGFHATKRRCVEARDYMGKVARAVEYIRAGDVYQANIAHRLEWDFEGSTRGLFAALAAAGPRHGAYLEWDEGAERRVVASASPELFVSLDAATRRLVTRRRGGW